MPTSFRQPRGFAQIDLKAPGIPDRQGADAPANRRPKPFIPFHRPSFGPEEERALVDTLRSGWVTTGPRTKSFETRFAEYAGAKHAIALNSCTAGLHLCLMAHNIGPGEEVITSPLTFAATANVIEQVGARPVFIDVEPDTLNMDPNRLAAAVTPRTRAIIPVHFAGHPCDLDAIHEIAATHGIPVIEDAAHAVESVYRGRKIGGISRATCFSFYATKNITTGEGGMVTTHDDALAERLRLLSLHGISVDAWQRHRPGEYRHWEIVEPGYKYNMSDIQAALGLCQLAKVDRFQRQRRRWTEQYDEAFVDLPEITVLKRRPDVAAAHHLYVIRFAVERLGVLRDQLMTILQERGIGIGIHFRPVHLHPYYRGKYGFVPGAFPIAEDAGNRCISLPLFPAMRKEEVTHVAREVRHVVTGLRAGTLPFASCDAAGGTCGW